MDVSTLDDAQKRALLAKLLEEKAANAGPRTAPLSRAQARLWFIDQMQGSTPVYTISAALRLTGDLDLDRLRQALNTIRSRHETLRTRFSETDGEPQQVIDPACPLELEEMSGAPEPLIRAFAARPFDLATGPLIRCALIHVAKGDHVLALAAHHIIADYRSLQVMIGEFAQLYTARDTPLPALPIQYADYAAWQSGRDVALSEQLQYWHENLSYLPALLDMPTDFARPPTPSGKGARHAFSLSPQISERVKSLAQARGMTPYMVLLALFQLLHHRYSSAGDICIGTTVSNRDRPELQGMVGYFVNTLALRGTVLPDDTLDSLLARTRQTVLDGMAHQEAPFEQVVDQLNLSRSLAHTPLFQSMFNLHEKQPDQIDLPGVTLSPFASGSSSARFDLTLDVFQSDVQLTGVLEYNTDLFRPDTVARMAAHFETLTEAATTEPTRLLSSIDIRTQDERATDAKLNQTDVQWPASDLATLIEDTAARRGAAPALTWAGRSLSYEDLNARANRLAHAMAQNVGQGDQVAVCLPRSAQMVIALLAVLKLGATYIPLDPKHPSARLRTVLADADARLMIGSATDIDAPCPVLDPDDADLTARPDTNPTRETTGEDPAYVIFTSGTTGRPKGVPIKHKSLTNLLFSMAQVPGMTANDTLVAVTTPAFDIAGLELFLPLLVGGHLVIAHDDAVRDDQELARLLQDTGATMMQATPTSWQFLTDGGWRAPEGFKMLCGGEALDANLARVLLDGAGTLWNMYGPTETTIWSSCAPITQVTDGVVPLGAPIANTTLHVLDAAHVPCPTGLPGELYIGGAGLSDGYLNRPDLTEQAFVRNPFGPGRLYKTGDRVKRLADGRLAYLGRLDFQVKLRGFRIELAEIEAILLQDSNVDQAVVTLQQSGADDQLVAYCRCITPPAEADLRARLAESLPSYMIPAGFVFLETFPLNTNGKVDRKALPAFDIGPATLTQSACTTPTESFVARIWGSLLDQPTPGPETDFFAAGGHSLLAMRMIARLPLTVPRAVPLRLLFEYPVLRDFAAALDTEQALDAEIEQTPLPIPRLPSDAEKPLSYAQNRQWALMQFEPDSPAYNLPAALRLSGPVDVQRLEHALTLLVQRHDILRSAYPGRSGKAAVIETQHPITVDHQQQGDLEAQLDEACARPFDLAKGPLLRLTAWSGDDTVLLLVMHHIISDALSVQLVLSQLIEIYTALSRDAAYTPPRLPVQYNDFAAWDLAQDRAKDLAYWHQHLDGAEPLLRLPTDFTRGAQQDFGGNSLRFDIPADCAADLRALGQRHNATTFMVVLTGFAALLGRYASMRDLVIGTPVAQRPHPDLEELVGLFVNTLALRLPGTGEQSFATALATVRETVLAGFEHQDVPFEQVVECLSPERSQAHTPVFQAMFQWKTREDGQPALPDGISAQPIELGTTSAKVDIALAIEDSADGFSCRFEFRTDLFRRETIEQMALAFETLLASATSNPDLPIDQLPILHGTQKAAIARWNDTIMAAPEGPATLHDLVTAQIARDGTAIAVRDTASAINYAELGLRSDTLAAHLQSRGITKGARIGIALPRNCDLITAILAVLKIGAAYVPLDPNYPADRIAHIAADAELALILTVNAATPDNATPTLDLRGFWEQATPATPAPSGVTANDLAYLIYTSGSTGTPKGVVLEHRNAASFVHWAHQTYEPEQFSGVLASTSICFDLSIFEIFATLTAGGTVLIVQDLFDLTEAEFADQVTLINTVPTPMAELLRLGALPPSVRTINLAGEPLPPSLVDAILDHETVDAVWNLYGPSEDTTYSTATRVGQGEKVTIGHPIANTAAYVLNIHGQQLPPGVPGELWLAGDGVARGYWNRPDLTAERFRPNPFDPERAPIMYGTGDLVRRLPDGALDYLGRGDRQVKLRGFRIEPGEVETALLRHEDVSGAAVGVWRDGSDHDRLVAWVETEVADCQSTLSAFLSEELPAHMVPSLFVPLAALPRLPNGKLDRNALPDPQVRAADTTSGNQPQGPLETQLSIIWQGLLGRPGIGREDNFFAIGGDSILAIQVVAQARQEGLRLSPRDLFQYPTIQTLAQASAGRTKLSATLDPVVGHVPMGPIQRWFLSRDLPTQAHWNQALVFKPTMRLDPDMLRRALTALADDHDVLRARFTQSKSGWVQTYLPLGDVPDLIEPASDVTTAMTELQAGFDLENGPLWGAVVCDHTDGQRFAIAAHHLVVDGVSWRILLSDLQTHYRALMETGAPATLPRSNGMGHWAEYLTESDIFAAEAPFWAAADAAPPISFPQDLPGNTNLEGDTASAETVLDETLTAQLLTDVQSTYPVELPEVLVTALMLAFRDWSGHHQMRLELESHGRPDLTTDLDLSRSVGWFTGLYPVLLDIEATPDLGDALLAIKDTLRRIPNDGIGYGVLRHMKGADWPVPPGAVPVRFNYLGQTDGMFDDSSLMHPADELPGPLIGSDNPRDAIFDVGAIVGHGRLRLRWTYPATQYHPDTVQRLANAMAAYLADLAQHCLSDDASGLTPADFPDMDFDQDDLDDLLLTL